MTSLLVDIAPDTVFPQVKSSCLARLDQRHWVGVLAVRVSRHAVGVRVNSRQTADRVEAALGPLRVPHLDAEVAANFSVELGDQTASRQRQLHLVYRDHEIVARRRDIDELMIDLMELLDEIPTVMVTRQMVVHAAAMLTDRREAILVPPRMHRVLLTRQPQLSSAGVEMLRTRTPQVDAETGELVLCREDARIDSMLPTAGGRTLTGRFPIRTWCVPAVADEPFDLRPVEGVFTAFQMVLNRLSRGPRTTLRELATLSRRTQFLALPQTSPASLARTITGL